MKWYWLLFSLTMILAFKYKRKVVSNKYPHGYDQRFPPDYKEPNGKFIEYISKKKLLDKLTDNKISLITKFDLIEKETISPFNITKGGLFKDFDFSF